MLGSIRSNQFHFVNCHCRYFEGGRLQAKRFRHIPYRTQSTRALDQRT
ncbi:hypothetical protein OIU78_006131 [Salix suchowensis]|nr:hypothetical protein OIU78_006131 [Salix suchowensis]